MLHPVSVSAPLRLAAVLSRPPTLGPVTSPRVRRDLSRVKCPQWRHEAAARPDPPGPGPHNQRVSFCCHRLREKNFTIQLIRRVGRRSDYSKFMTDAVQTIMTKLSQQLWVSSVLVYENTSNS